LFPGIPEPRIAVTGNTVIDALLWAVQQPLTPDAQAILEKLDPAKRLILLTTHRRENIGEPMNNICGAIVDIVERFSDVQVRCQARTLP